MEIVIIFTTVKLPRQTHKPRLWFIDPPQPQDFRYLVEDRRKIEDAVQGLPAYVT